MPHLRFAPWPPASGDPEPSPVGLWLLLAAVLLATLPHCGCASVGQVEGVRRGEGMQVSAQVVAVPVGTLHLWVFGDRVTVCAQGLLPDDPPVCETAPLR